MKTKSFLFIILLALSLRLLYFRSTTFFYDQARDAVAAMEIWQSDPIKILGPQTDFPGLHHGSFYWYLLSPAYYFSHGSVFAARLLLILISLITLPFIYDLTNKMFKNRSTALLASLIYAISFEATQYARWLSNPAPALVTSTISFWALYHLIKGKPWALIGLFISWGLSTQFQLFMVYQIPIFLIIWLIAKGPTIPKIPGKTFLFALLGLVTTLSTYILAEIKFGLSGTRALLGFFKTQTLFGESFVNMFESYLDNLVNIFFLNLWGINLFLAGLATIFTLIYSLNLIKNKNHPQELTLLLIWALSPLAVNFFSGPNAHFITIGTLTPIIILSSFLLIQLKTQKSSLFFLALIIIILGNLNLILTKNREGEVLFTVQKQMILADELQVIDWVYQESAGQPFKLNTITNPLFINSTWAKLFSWYGQSKYSYLPIWWGETQVDVPGSNIKFAEDQPTDLHFLIIEPSAGPDNFYLQAIKSLENTRSEVIKTETIGYFTIEKRQITTPRIFTSQDVFNVVKTTDLRELEKID